MMRRVQLESESREMARLIAIGILTIFLYLGLSFSNAYGYQISNFNRFQLESPEKIDWNSDSWLSSNLVFSPSFTPYGETANGGKYFELMDDGYSDGGDVVPSVPEPAITVLLGLGLGTMALYRKLKR